MSTMKEILDRHRNRQRDLLPILHDVQRRFGHISEDAMREIAEHLNLTRAEIYGVVTFYHDFRLQPDKKNRVKVCHSEACQARGLNALLAQVGNEFLDAIEPVYCLGLCSAGPAALTNEGMVCARLDATKLENLIGGRK